MIPKDHPAAVSAGLAHGCSLRIDYPVRARARKCARRVVFVGRSTPPVTSAEVEIMFDHLQERLHACGLPPENDNFPNSYAE